MASEVVVDSVKYALAAESAAADASELKRPSGSLITQIIDYMPSRHRQVVYEYLGSILFNVRFVQSEARWLPKDVDPLISGERLSFLLEEGIARPIQHPLEERERTGTLRNVQILEYSSSFGPIEQLPPRRVHHPAPPGEPVEEVLEEFMLDGVVDEFRGEDAVVVFDVEGRDEKRVMSAAMLRDNRVTHDGQSLRLRIMRVEREGHIDTVTRVEPLSDPTQLAHEDLWPNLDTAKFQCMG